MSLSFSSCPPEVTDCSLCISDEELSLLLVHFPAQQIRALKAQCVLASHLEKPCGKAV